MPITMGDGVITGLATGGLPDGSVNNNDLAAAAVTAAKIGISGFPLQVLSTTKTDTFVSSSTNTDITGLSLSITPRTSTSKILVCFNITYDHGGNDSGGGFAIYRNGSFVTDSGGITSGNDAVPSGRYWRYLEQSAIVGHHPRVSSIQLQREDNSWVEIARYAGDNCSDSGAYQIGSVTFDNGTNTKIINARAYSVFAGGQRSSFVQLQSSTDNSYWSNSSYRGVMANYNYATGSGVGCGFFELFKVNSGRYSAITDFGAVQNQDQSGLHRTSHYIDSPGSTSSQTYSIRMIQPNADTLYVNRARADPDQDDDGRFASTLTLIELAG
jgi:hypothetical protein